MVTVKENFQDINSWLEIQKPHFNPQEITKFENAIRIANKYYTGLKCEPTDVDLLKHALTCANIVGQLNLYSDTVCATILFDLPRHCKTWKKELEDFDDKVIELVDGVSKMENIRRLGSIMDVKDEAMRAEQIESTRKMLLAMASDIRVVLITLVDRGELMLNLKSCKDINLVQKIANETMEIFAPLANRLGLWQIKWELEDLSFKYLHPIQYKKIAKLLDETREDRLNYIEKIKQFLSSEIENSGITNYQVTGRAKHIYSIWKKMKKKNYDFDDLYDIHALRVLVPEVKDCYTVLGIAHTKYSPIPGEFDDYISNPKPNNYQSLHTCVIGPENKVVEVQIRTFAMHNHAEYGVAAHWRYKELGDKSNENSAQFAQKIAWIRQILDWKDVLISQQDIANIFKNEVFSDTIYVLTPNGKVVSLPQGATPIDFAYAVHSSIGNACRGAKIDGQIVPLATSLKNGQRVEILTVKDGAPSINWLHDGWVKSTKAISCIRRFIRNQNNEEFYNIGHEVFERELSKFVTSIRPPVNLIVSKLNYENERSLCIDLGKGDLSNNELRLVIQKLIDNIQVTEKPQVKDTKQTIIPTKETKKLKGVLVEGVAGLVTNIANCCKPLPNDQVIGFVTQGKGVAIHRNNCLELKRRAKKSPNKVVTVSWGANELKGEFYADVEIIAQDKPHLLKDLTELFANEKIGIAGIHSINKHNRVNILFTLKISNYSFNFDTILNKIGHIDGVVEVYRK